VKDFPVVKDFLRCSVANPSQPDNFTEKSQRLGLL
jgi:hypothetical protein